MLVSRNTLGLVTRSPLSLPFLVIASRPVTDMSDFINLQL
jgi:hypothetical protein